MGDGRTWGGVLLDDPVARTDLAMAPVDWAALQLLAEWVAVYLGTLAVCLLTLRWWDRRR